MYARNDEIRVDQLMTREVFTVSPTQSLPLAEALMNLRRIRHVPVVDDARKLLGLVSRGDVLAAKLSALLPLTSDERSSLELVIPVSRVMHTTVWTIEPHALASSAARIMQDHRFGCLPVVEHGRLVGIVTESDLVSLVTDALSLERAPRPWTAERAMTAAPIFIGPDATIADARALMTRHQIRHLPVVEDGRPISMISDRDLRVAEVVFGETAQPSALRAARIIAADPVRLYSRHEPLDGILREMFRERLDAVLVVDDGRLVGVIAASDACRLMSEAAHA